MKTSTILRAALFAAACLTSTTSGFSQNVTWTARNLPPGLSLSTVNATTARITGTPTTAGAFQSVVFPTSGGVVGNMHEIRFSIFPAGTLPPEYSAYSRLPGSGRRLLALAGSNGTVLLALISLSPSDQFYNQAISGLTATTTGHTFTAVTTPSGLTRINGAATSGNRTLLLGGDAAYIGPITGPFSPVSLPAGVSSWSLKVAGAGTAGFLLASVGASSTFPSSPILRLYTIPASGGNWTQRYQGPTSDYSLGSISVAVNGAIQVAALIDQGSHIGLFRSTNSGVSWTKLTNTDIRQVAFGKGKFIGVGSAGTWQSTDGLSWTQTGTLPADKVGFCPSRQLFFSDDAGVSPDGVYWRAYDSPYYPSGPQFVMSGRGLVFIGERQLLPSVVPYTDQTEREAGSVSSPVSIRLGE